MRNNHRIVTILALLSALVGLSACQTAPREQLGVLTESLSQPEPLLVPYQTEIAIAKINEMLPIATLTDVQRARLHYDRGVLYDSVGLTILARFDFMRALRLKPDMADAYNFLGIHQTLSGDFNEAYEAFDAALELDPQYQYAYLNRAIALQYDGKLALSLRDFQTFASLSPTDPYRALWLFQAHASMPSADPKFTAIETAQQQLMALAPQLDRKHWANAIVRFYLGQIDETALMAAAMDDVTTPKQRAENLCEVYFYLGKWYQLQQHYSKAVHFYKLSLATNVYEFVEHRYARVEIERIRLAAVEQAANKHDANKEATDKQHNSPADSAHDEAASEQPEHGSEAEHSHSHD